MNMTGLSFDALPDIRLPLGFFLAATLFGVISALVIMTNAEHVWLSRWQGEMLALTHAFGLGVITLIMLGALLQMLPVVGGASFPYVKVVAITSLLAISSGLILLLAHFIWPHLFSALFPQILLFFGFLVYLSALVAALISSKARGPTVKGIRLSACSLSLVILLGLLLLAVRQSPPSVLGLNSDAIFIFANKSFTDIHAIIATFGWVSLLIIAVSYQVVPMFHVAPSFPKKLALVLPVTLFALVCLAFPAYLNVGLFNMSVETLASALILFIVALLVFYGVVIVSLLRKRKRQVPDVTINFWFLAITVLTVVFILLIASQLGDVLNGRFSANLALSMHKMPLLLAALFFYGFVFSIIQGLLLKILPFLSYTHLQNLCLANFNGMQFLPHMHQLLPKQHAKILFVIHVCGLLCLAFSPYFLVACYLFSIILLIQFLWLQKLLAHCYLLYKTTRQKIQQQT